MTLQTSATGAIEQIILPNVRDIGGFDVRRALPSVQRRMVGPFIFLDSFGPVVFGPGEGMDTRAHPHIGLSTISYLLQGEMLHRDSAGHVQQLRAGEINLMTAGRGIVHSERSSDPVWASGGGLMGFQAWVALPESHEEAEPGFQHLLAERIPHIDGDGASLSLLAGSLDGLKSPSRTVSDLFYADLQLQAGARYRLSAEHIERALYVVSARSKWWGSRSDSGPIAWSCCARTAKWCCMPSDPPDFCCLVASHWKVVGTFIGISCRADPSASNKRPKTGGRGASLMCRAIWISCRCQTIPRCAGVSRRDLRRLTHVLRRRKTPTAPANLRKPAPAHCETVKLSITTAPHGRRAGECLLGSQRRRAP